jgi:hypothetical protein
VKRAPDPEAAAALVPRALFGSSVAVLVLGGLLNVQGQTALGPEAISWGAAGWALVAPVVAVLVRGRGLVLPREEPRSGEEAIARARSGLVFFAILESAAVLAGIAAIVSPPWWPLAAAIVPLAVMAMNLPPRR